MDSEGTALSDDSIQKQGRALRNSVVFNKEFLKLVNEKQGSWHRLFSARLLISGYVLDTQLPKKVATPPQFVIDSLQDAQAEFTVTFDCHYAGMRQALGRISLELDPFLEIHQVKLHLFGAAPQSQVCNDDMKQRRFA